MSLMSIFDITASGMQAQGIRMNTIASNMANAETVSATAEDAYKAKYPVFRSHNINDLASSDDDLTLEGFDGEHQKKTKFGVYVSDIIESQKEVRKRYQPEHPLADEDGYVYSSNVNLMEEMADMIATSRSFEMNAELASTAKSMMQRLLTLGQ